LVTAGGDGRATERDADANVENCNENHRQNEEQECRDLPIQTDGQAASLNINGELHQTPAGGGAEASYFNLASVRHCTNTFTLSQSHTH